MPKTCQKGMGMVAILTHRHRVRHSNVCLRWKPDRHWFLVSMIGLVVASTVTTLLLVSLWYAP